MHLFDTLGNVLLDSLWQGAVVYALVRLSLSLLRTSESKYWTALGGLCAIAVTSVGAFARELVHFSTASPDTTMLYKESFAVSSCEATTVAAAAAASPPAQALFTFADLPYYISYAYLAGLAIALLFFLRDHLAVSRYRSRGLLDLPREWDEAFSESLQAYLPKTEVSVYLSRRAQSVMTIGWWKPVIIFPVALVNQLSVREAHLILLHEIAHLRRYDHYVIYVQQFLKTLFFYHPAVYALCRIVDREREHRCDDWVAAGCGDRTLYATALVNVARATLEPKNPLTMSISKTPFTARVERLFKPEPRGISPSATLLWGGLFSCALLLAFSPLDNEEETNASPACLDVPPPTCMVEVIPTLPTVDYLDVRSMRTQRQAIKLRALPRYEPVTGSLVAIDSLPQFAPISISDLRERPVPPQSSNPEHRARYEAAMERYREHHPGGEAIIFDEGQLQGLSLNTLSDVRIPSPNSLLRLSSKALQKVGKLKDEVVVIDGEGLRKLNVNALANVKIITPDLLPRTSAQVLADTFVPDLIVAEDRDSWGAAFERVEQIAEGRVGVAYRPSSDPTTPAIVSDSIAIFLDGKMIGNKPSMKKVDPKNIRAIKVVKDRNELDSLGLQEYTGAIYITSNKNRE